MNFKARAEIKESFMHLKGVGTFINIRQIQQLDYDRDGEGDIVGATIYMSSIEEIIVQNPEDIETIALYFLNVSQAPLS
jgi:hypothetical protein